MRLLTEKEIVKEASKDGTYCQLSVDIGMWASKEQDTRTRKATLKAVGEWLEKHGEYAHVAYNPSAYLDTKNYHRLVEALKRGEMPEEGE